MIRTPSHFACAESPSPASGSSGRGSGSLGANRPSPRGPKRLAPRSGETQRFFVETSNFDGEYLENGTSEKSEILHDDRRVGDEQKSFRQHFSYVSSFGAMASRRF